MWNGAFIAIALFTTAPPRRKFQLRTAWETGQRIGIAALVEEQRAAGMKLKEAIQVVSATIHPRIDTEALRRIYENATRTKAGKSLVRLVAATKGE
jgi:hypothetical protein